jgi:hypothetical protein
MFCRRISQPRKKIDARNFKELSFGLRFYQKRRDELQIPQQITHQPPVSLTLRYTVQRTKLTHLNETTLCFVAPTAMS